MTDKGPSDSANWSYNHPGAYRSDEWDTLEQAARIVRETYAKVNRGRQSQGLLPLAEEPMTWEQRSNAIRFILSGPQDVVSVAAAGAQVLAFMEALLKAEDANPFTSDSAA